MKFLNHFFIIAIFFTGFLFFFPHQTLAADDTCVAAATGDWTAAGTWSSCNDAGTGYPDSDDTATIGAAYTITVSNAAGVNAQAGSIICTAGNCGLTVESNVSLTVTGVIRRDSLAGSNRTITLSGAGSISAGSFSCGGTNTQPTADRTTACTSSITTFNVSGNVDVNSYEHDTTTTLENRATFNLSGGTMSIGGNLNINEDTADSNSTFTLAAAATGTTLKMTATGDTIVKSTNSVFTPASTSNISIVEYSGASPTVEPSVTFDSLTLSGSGTATLTSVTTLNNNLTTSGTVSATTAANMTIGGNVTIGTGTTFTTGANYTLAVTGTSSITGTLANSNTGAKTYTGLVTINSGGTWTNANNSNITFKGGLTHNGSTFTSGTGTYTFDTNSQAVGCTTSLSISNITVTGVTLTNNCDTFTVGTALSGTGGLTNAASKTLVISGTSGISTLTATASGNIVEYNGSGQTVHATTTYDTLKLSGSGTVVMQAGTTTITNDFLISGTVTTSTAAGLTITDDVSVGAGCTLNLNHTSSIGGNLINVTSGVINTTSGTPTITMSGSSKAIGGGTTGAITIYALTVSGSVTWTNGGTNTVNSDISVSAGGTLNFNSSLTAAGSILTTTTGSIGTTAGTPEITMTGSGKSIGGGSGTITFYSLTLSNNGTTTVNSDFTVSNTLNVTTSDTLSIASGKSVTVPVTLTFPDTAVISGAGTLVYQSSTTFPTTGTLSSILRFDTTNNNQTAPQRTYGGQVEFYNNSSSDARTVTLGTAGSQTLTFSSNFYLIAANTQNVTVTAATNSPTVNITGDLDFTGAGGGSEILSSGTGTWTVSGNITLTDGTYTTATGNTIVMNGNTKTLTSAGQTFYNFSTSGSVTVNYAGASSNTFSGDITAGAGSTLNLNNDASIAGNLTNTTSGIISTSAGTPTITMSGASKSIGGGTTGAITIYALTVSGSVTWTNGGTNTVNSDISVSAGGTLNFNSSLGAAGSILTTTTGIVGTTSGTPEITMTGSGKSIGGGSGTITFYSLTLSNNGTTTVNSDFTVSNTLNVTTSDTLSIASGKSVTVPVTLTFPDTAVISGAGTLVYQSSTTFPATGTLSTILRMDTTSASQTLSQRTYGGEVQIYNNSAGSTRTVTLGTAGSQTLTFSSNLVLNSANSQTVSLTGASNNPTVNITGNLTGTSGGTAELLVTGSGTWTVSGNIDLTGVTLTSTGSTVQMNGSAKTITCDTETLNNFAVTGGSTSALDSMDVNGTFSVTSGAFAHGSGGTGSNIDIYIAGNFSLTSGITWTENTDATSQVIFDGDLSYSDGNTPSKSIGNVVIGASPDTTNLASDFAANSLTVTATDIFYTNGYEVDIGNGGIVINGTFDATDDVETNETFITTANSFTINSGATFVQDQSTLTFDDDTGTDDLITDGSYSLYNLVLNTGATIEVEDALDVDNDLTITAGTLDVVSGENNQINVGGNWTNDGTFTEQSGKVVLDGTNSTTLDTNCTTPSSCTTGNFYNLEINKTDTADTVTLTNFGIRTTNNLTIVEGTLVQGAYNVYAEGTSAVSVEAGGIWTNTSTGDLTLGGSFANAGTVTFNGGGSTCDDVKDILIESTTTSARSWTGAGSFTMTDVGVSYQAGTAAITVTYGTDNGNNGANWTFTSCSVLVVTGNVYNDPYNFTALTECDADSGTYELQLRVGSSTYTSSCDNSTGAFSFSVGVTPSAGDGFVVWIDNDVAGTKGALVIRYDGTGDSINNIFYDNIITVMSDDTNPVDIIDMNTYDNGDDPDIPYTATDATPDTLVTNSGFELLIKLKSGVAADSTVFDPNGTVTTNATGGDFYISEDTTAYLDTATNTIGRDIIVRTSATLYINADTNINGGDISTSTSGAPVVVSTNSGTPTVTISGTGNIGTTAGNFTFYNLATSGSGTIAIVNPVNVNNNLSIGGTSTLTNSAEVIVTGDVSVGDGTTLTIGANLNIDGGALTTGASAIVGYTGTPTVDIDGTGTLGGNNVVLNFYTLDLGDGTSDTTTLGSAIIVDDSLTINTNQTFAMSTYDVTVGSTSVSDSGDITVNGSSSQSGGTFTIKSSSGGTATLSGNNSLNVYNLVIGDGSTVMDTDSQTNNKSINITNDFTITSNATYLAPSTNSLYIAGNYVNSGTLTANNSTFNFYSSSLGNTISGNMVGTSSIYNIEFDDGGSWTFSDPATISNYFSIINGEITAPSTTLTIGANFYGGSTFIHNSGTVIFNGSNPSNLHYTADNTFNNLTIATGNKQVKFDETFQTNIEGLFSVQGTDCANPVYLDSEDNDNQWDIYVSGTYDIDYADIEDSNAVTTALTANNSTAINDNNTNWTVNSGACSATQVKIKGSSQIKGGVKIK